MKCISKKKLIYIIVAMMLVIFISFGAIAFADDDAEEPGTTEVEGAGYEKAEIEEDTVSEEDKGLFASVNEGIAGAIRSFAFSIFNLVQGGVKSSYEVKIVTIDDLVFDNFPGTSIDFYNNNASDEFTGSLKENISTWYGKFRNIAISCYAILFLYVGIRILLAVGGEEQKKYKEYLNTFPTLSV